MNQQHFPGGGIPFLPQGNVPHARALMGYSMPPGVMIPPGVATTSAGVPSAVKEDKSEEERVSEIKAARHCINAYLSSRSSSFLSPLLLLTPSKILLY